MDEKKGEFYLNEVLVGNDGLELDLHILNKYFDYLEVPEYLLRIQKGIEVNEIYGRSNKT